MREKPTTGVWIVAAVLMVLLPVGAYVAGYFLRSEVMYLAPTFPGEEPFERLYSTDMEAILFTPAAKIESLATGQDISTGTFFTP